MIKSTKASPRLTSRLGALSLLTIALIFGASAAPATAAVPQGWFSSRSSADYVALGDSFTSGQGAPPYVSGPCLQSKYTSYPVITAALSTHKLAANKSCSGANTGDVLTQLGQLGLSPSRLANIHLVTLTVGGIDAGSNLVLAACAPDPSALTCTEAIQFAAAQLPSLGAKLVATYHAVAVAMPHAHIVVFNYPHLFNPDVSSPLITVLNSATDVLNSIIAGAASSVANVQVIDVTQEFANHGIGARIPYISFNPTDLSAQANFHPNVLGNSLGYFYALVKAGALG